jgi:hypothetical protein
VSFCGGGGGGGGSDLFWLTWICRWNGGNIPGKKRENIGHIGGIQIYEQQCRAAMDGWKGFEVVKAA